MPKVARARRLPARLNRLSLEHWQSHLSGGLNAAAVALPMGLAFGVVSGLGPVAGLYSAVCTGLFAALFGGTATPAASSSSCRSIR